MRILFHKAELVSSKGNCLVNCCPLPNIGRYFSPVQIGSVCGTQVHHEQIILCAAVERTLHPADPLCLDRVGNRMGSIWSPAQGDNLSLWQGKHPALQITAGAAELNWAIDSVAVWGGSVG